MATVQTCTNKLVDCFGNAYTIIRVPGNGFCGFHCLSHCLTGDMSSYANVIEDCVNVFTNIPELFRLRTNYGASSSSLTIADYSAFMRHSVANVRVGLPIAGDAWAEDAHLAAISLLYDVTIFVYLLRNKQWHVFNDSGSSGYICLLSSPGHFEVLHGINGPPKVPRAAARQGVSRNSLSTSADAWQCLRREYCFRFVWKWPEMHSDIEADNRPNNVNVVELHSASQSCEPQAPLAQDNIHQGRTNLNDKCTPKSNILNDGTATNGYPCDIPDCPYIAKKRRALTMHKFRCHSKQKPCDEAMQTTTHESDDSKICTATSRTTITSNADTPKTSVISGADTVKRSVYQCEFHDCTFIAKKRQGLTLHKIGCHTKEKPCDETMQTTTCQTDESDICTTTSKTSRAIISDVDTLNNNLYQCEVHDCMFIANKLQALNMHKLRCHSKNSSRSGREHRSTVDGESPASSAVNKRRYTCDVGNCKAVFDTATGLAMHKTKRHFFRTRLTLGNLNLSAQDSDDNVSGSPSIKSFQSTCSKLSANAAHVVDAFGAKRGRYVCDIGNCAATCSTATRLAAHQTERHGTKILANDIESDRLSFEEADTESNCSSLRRSNRIASKSTVDTQRLDSNDRQKSRQHSRTNRPTIISTNPVTPDIMCSIDSGRESNSYTCSETGNRKDHAKTKFRKEIAKMEKQLPSNKTESQVDPLYDKLKSYHDALKHTVTNTTTEKLPAEVLSVIKNPTVVGTERPKVWTKDDQKILNDYNEKCKNIQPRNEWGWSASKDSERGRYNDARMQLTVTEELKWEVIECTSCETMGLLVGDQTGSKVCYDCMQLERANEAEKKKKQEAWQKVKPISKEFPKTPDGRDLPRLQPGDKAVIAPVHPVVTIKINKYGTERQLRLESISLVQDPVPTWCKVLPNTAKDCYMIIERFVKDSKKYIVASADRVRQWLDYFFLNHTEFKRLKEANELQKDADAIEALDSNTELAEVDCELAEHTASAAKKLEEAIEREDDGLTDATGSSGFSETHVFSFDSYPNLYLSSKDVLRIRKEGKLELIEDHTVRKPTYCTSANLAFPHLYPHGETSPLDFQDYKLGRYLLKKQALYAHRMGDGRQQWTFAEDDIHMAHQYSRLSEQTVRATVGYYISSHPSVSHVPLSNIVTAFRDGVDQDSGLLDSHLPNLTSVMSQLPNSRQKWFSERLGIEAISRDLGSPNLFLTINLDPRASPDVRSLIYKLEHGTDMQRDEPFIKDTVEFTKLMSKYAPHISIYLYRKVKILMRTFFTKICGIPEKEPTDDWETRDQIKNGWYWGRVEFTETRGVQHWHYLAKLPNVLETNLLARILHSGRVVRHELKCGNVREDKRDEAWQMIEMSLLASRYLTHFAQSVSTTAFYSEDVGTDGHDDSKVIKLEDYRNEYTKNYKEGNINLNTHPIMRRFDDPECDPNINHEMARVASVSCLHQCIRTSCGGDPLTGDSCRFDFPKKKLKHTVAAVMQVNANQMEARMLPRRTCDRVSNVNPLLLKYLRSNHDMSVLVDSAHKLRYATKYCSKSGQHGKLLDEMIDHINKRSMDLLPPNMKQVLSHLLLADCSHRRFVSKLELAYNVMDLPDVSKSFPNVGIVGFYPRANIQVPYDDEYTIEYSDRTEYSAYAERCRKDTELGLGLEKKALKLMTFNEFAQTVEHKWINEKRSETTVIDETTKRKFRTRDVNSGHWRLTLCKRRKHTRPSTVLHTAPAIDYEFVQHGKTTTQTTFFDLDIEKRHQLYRAYYELVTYVPWTNTPDDKFLSKEVRSVLENEDTHAEIDSRHSLQRLEEFFKVYKKYYKDEKVAIPGSAWQRDNQFSYSMYLINQHNRDIHFDRVDNRGVLKAQFEDVDELVDVDVDIRPAVNDVSDAYEYPTFDNFMPPDTYRDIVEQKPQDISEICVAFPLHYQWQQLEEVATHDNEKRFIASPPASSTDYKDMTKIQQFAVDIGKDTDHQILFICGKAGTGKTAVALKICEHFAGRVQATAFTGKAASLFNGPTIHSMYGWSHSEHTSSKEISPGSKKVEEFRVAHEAIDVFVIEEALAIPPAYFALMDEMMTAAFNPKRKLNAQRQLPPFGGKKIVFLGDQAQLPPIQGPAVYDGGREASDSGMSGRKRESKHNRRTKTGQLIFEKYLVPNCIYLQRGQRNTGLLGEICDRMREGNMTKADCEKLTFQKSRFPDVCTDYGIHYQNDMCSLYNWRQLWNSCLMSTPQRRMFLCKATYHVTEDNDQVVEVLSTLSPQAYQYAPDMLCVAEGCQVRLLENINVAAGLVTSQYGTVVKVIYNNADAQLLLAGKHIVPYCIIVDFPSFRGFVSKRKTATNRIFPFTKRRTWVPVFRKRFAVKITSLPAWVRKRQLEKDCYRVQFPIDLSSNITAHKAQGQTMADCLVSVDFGLQNPDTRLPQDLNCLLYVACTRVTKLENLFVSAIHPCIWEKIGQSDVDKYRRSVDEKLRKATGEFASQKGKYREMMDELAWKPDRTKNDDEWSLLRKCKEPPNANGINNSSQQLTTNEDFDVDLGNGKFQVFCRPVLSERHIGIDQGTENFAIVVVERTVGSCPNIVSAVNYTNLNLNIGFKASDVVLALDAETDLMSWMKPQKDNHSAVDRVVVHLEQIDIRNRNSKQFSAELGKLLQQKALDPKTCIVKMSQPHIHRATGPLFHLGPEIVEELQLQPALFQQKRTRAESNPAVVPAPQVDNHSQPSNVKQSVEAASIIQTIHSEPNAYRMKKKMSSDVFRYIINASDEQLKQMKLTVDQTVQENWRAKIAENSSVKLDDVGDALLHALDELLCGSTNFKQLVPEVPSVHVNRTVAVAVFPDSVYWIVLNCRWNTFEFENFGCLASDLRDRYYKDASTVEAIKTTFTHCRDTWIALSDFDGDRLYGPVDHIKVVIKQLTGHTDLALTNEQAGALTDSTMKAMKSICDQVIGVNGKLTDTRHKELGSIYCRTSTVHKDRKFQVVNSTGKHTNAVLSCLTWMKQNLKEFVENRKEFLDEYEKKKFFHAMVDNARSNENSMEMFQLSSVVKAKLCSNTVSALMRNDKSFARNISDLVLVAISKNHQHVRAIAANSRKTTEDVEPVHGTVQEGNTANSKNTRDVVEVVNEAVEDDVEP